MAETCLSGPENMHTLVSLVHSLLPNDTLLRTYFTVVFIGCTTSIAGFVTYQHTHFISRMGFPTFISRTSSFSILEVLYGIFKF